jgi:hypothetical protein
MYFRMSEVRENISRSRFAWKANDEIKLWNRYPRLFEEDLLSLAAHELTLECPRCPHPIKDSFSETVWQGMLAAPAPTRIPQGVF